MRGKPGLFIALMLLVGLAACGQGGSGAATIAPTHSATPSPSPTVPSTLAPLPESGGNLAWALTLTPADAYWFYFTDWVLIKEYEGVTDLSSQSSLDERTEFLTSIFKGQAAASGYGVDHFREHADTWAWDTTDLVWEATVFTEGPTIYALKFRDDFDLAPILALFDERGFSQGEYQGVPIYSHEMDFEADWLRATEFAILNTAVLEDEKMLILSPSIEDVRLVLDTYLGEVASLADNEAIQATASHLGEVAAAIIGPGVSTCLSFSANPLLEMLGQQPSEEQLDELREELSGSELHLYTALGVGYRYEDDEPVGLVVMHYTSAGEAQADLEPRRQLAEEGISQTTGQPYSETVFTLEQASVEGSDLVLRLRPDNDQPSRLFQMVEYRDIAFAACP
jgi:hypothetical protein